MVETKGFEPRQQIRSNGGDEGARTLDLRLAKPALSQLSYVPTYVKRALLG